MHLLLLYIGKIMEYGKPPLLVEAAPRPLTEVLPLPPAAAGAFAPGAADLALAAFFASSSAFILSCHHF